MRQYRGERKAVLCERCGRTFTALEDYHAHAKIEPQPGYKCATPRQLRTNGFAQEPSKSWTKVQASGRAMTPSRMVPTPAKPKPKPRPSKPPPKTKSQRVRIRATGEAAIPPEARDGTGVIVVVNITQGGTYPYVVDVDGIDPGTKVCPQNRYIYRADELEWRP
jgi:guanyl-specific ribonuclease Sa